MFKAIKIVGLSVFLLFAATASPAGAEVVVQVMAVQDEAAAQKEANRLFDLGVPAFSRAEELPERGVWNRVYIGPFETADDARVAAATLKKQGVIKDFVVRDDSPDQAAPTAASSAPAGEPADVGEGNPAEGAVPVIGQSASPATVKTAPPLPVAQTPTYGEPVSPEQAQALGLAGSAPASVPVQAGGDEALSPDEGLTPYGDAPAAPTGTASNNDGLPPGFAPGDDMPGLVLPGQPAPGSASPAEPISALTTVPALAPSAGDGEAAAPVMVAQAQGYGGGDSVYARGGSLAGFTSLVDLSSSMRRLVDCQARVKEEAVAGLLRKMNHRIPNRPYNATLRVFGYKIAVTHRDFTTVYFGPETYSRDRYEDAIAKLAAADSVSPFATAMDTADSELAVMGDPKAMLMFSDFEESIGSGMPVKSAQNLRRRYNQNLRVYTFYATRQNSAVRLARNIAEAGGGKAYNICTMLDDDTAFEAMMMDIFGPSDAVPCVDSDGDGVCDGDDVCANTPPGVPVDERGCWIAAYAQFFDFDKAVVKPPFLPRIQHAAEVINKYPDISKVIIAGHTDNVGDPEYNRILGLRRAQAVHDLLVKDGVSPSRLQVESFGETRPVASNDTEEGRARNRRVEFHVGEVPEDHRRPQ